MPLILDENELPGPRFPLGVGIQPDPEGPTASETLGAAFRQENLIVSAIDALAPGFKEDIDHNPLDVIKDTDYERNHIFKFVGSRSEDETRHIMSRIDRETKDRETLAAAGGWGIAAGALAGTVDPTFFIPASPLLKVGQAGKAAVSVGRTALRTAPRFGAVAGAAATVQEFGLHSTQELRTAEESVLGIGTAIGIGTIVGGVIGGGVTYLR